MPATPPAATLVIGTLLPPVIPSGAEIYNMLMKQIEPELTTDQMALLNEKYKDQPPAEVKARVARYNRAFNEYDRRFEEYVVLLKEQVNSYRKLVISRAEAEMQVEEETQLQSLESNISSA